MSTAALEEVFVAKASYAQRRLWLLSQLEPGNSSFHICAAVELRGSLDIPRLQAALQQVVDRHEALRTTFTQENGEPMQVIAPSLVIPLPVEETKESTVEARARKEFDAPFSLLTGPLLRVRLLHLGPDRHVLLSVLHHIIADGWSMGRLVEEMVTLYRGEALEPLTLQYADFAEWQQEYLSGQRLENLLHYWTAQLRGAPAWSGLSADRARPAVRSFEGGTHRFRLEQPLAAALGKLAADCGATPFMLLLASFAILLSRYSGSQDLTIGAPVANRQRRELEPLIGMFVNTLALRIDLRGNPTVRELLSRVRQTALDAYDHQDLPFERVVEALQPGRSTSHTPLFQTMFVLQNAPQTEPAFAGLQLQPLPWGKSRTLFDLTMVLEESADGIGGSVEYSTELFDDTTIAALCRRFANLLSSMAEQPDGRVAELPLLDAQDLAQLKAWSTTASAPAEQTIPELFAAQVRIRPHAIALVEGDRALTYRELDARANEIAQDLLYQGVQPDTPVALSMERSCELIAALLGILKAGAAYLYLDPAWPAERIELLIRDAGASRLPVSGSHVTTQFPLPRITPDHLAYISYTSGSTGVPKGVAVPHRAVARLVKDPGYIQLTSDETVLCFAPLSFDASTLEVWGALLNGARLVLAPPHASLSEVAQTIRTHGVTTCWLSAGLFQAMVEEHPGDLACVRQLLAGGDVLSPPHVARFLKGSSGSTLINGYGPTENTTFTCCYPMTDTPATGSIPIGRPISNTSVHIVDRNFQLTPPGVPGELVTGGDGLARAYWGRPALTAESFVPNPFDPTSGRRLYRTGDLARWRSDGTVEFLGRLDQQVKIRGFRIEPGEVEAALTALPGVKEAAVAVRGEGLRKRLLAWVVPQAGSRLDAASVLASLKLQLADYLVPSTLYFADALPLNANGKVDRSALEEPAAALSETGRMETSTQIRLASLWSGLLSGNDFGPEAEFFDCGGHSLLASQLVSRIRRDFGVVFSLRQIFEAPVLWDQAALIDSAALTATAVSLVPVGKRDKIPLTHSQRRLWLLQQMDQHSTAYNVPMALRLRGVLDRPALVRSLQSIVDRHEILRTAFVLEDGEPVQSVVPFLSLEVPFIGCSQEEAVQRREASAAQVFDLTQAPLLRVELLRLAPDEHILLTCMHHIICDGWSVGVLIAEWTALYAEFTGHVPSRLAPLPIQYADYAVWEQNRVETGELTRHRDYWVQELTGVSPLVNLPVDRPRSAVASASGALCRFDLPVSLQALGEQAGTTPFMTALAAFGVLLSQYSGQERVVIASAVANREREEIEPLIGCFVNTLPLTIDTAGDPSFVELLARVRRMSLNAYAYQEMPFEQIIDSLQFPREAGSTPFAQVGFALQTFSIPPLELPGLRLETIDSEIRTSKAEITLMLNDHETSLSGAIEYNAALFDSATMQSVAADFTRLLQIVTAQPELRLSELLEKSETGDMPLASLPENHSNLTRSQMLAWLGQRLRPGDPLYNIGIYFAVPTIIDADALRASLETAVRSNDALRTVFLEEGGIPIQVVEPEMEVPLEFVDFSTDPDPEARMKAWAEERVTRPYDLTRCCIDFVLAKLGPARSAWYVGMHHLVGDGIAVALLFRQVSGLYEQAFAGALPLTVPMPAYQDHVAAERRLRFSRQYRAAEVFWKKQLERPAEPIPFYGRLARHESPRVESLAFELGVARSQRVRELAVPSQSSGQGQRRALYYFFGSILCSLMQRISGAREIAVGISWHNRQTRQAKETIGHFMSVVPIRVPLTPEVDTVQSIAARFGSLTFQAFRRSAYVVANPPNRRTYEVFYNYQINTFPQFAGQPTTTTRVFTYREEDSFALHITDYGESGNIGVQMDFCSSDFTADQRQHTVALFQRLIDGYLENPETPVEALPLLTEADRAQQLAPSVCVPYPATSGIHNLFEEQALLHPAAEAVVDGESSLSYGELNAAAIRLAARLQTVGVVPEVRVGVLLPRGTAQIVAVLGVLKSGGVYVPIDADLPVDRIHYILDNCGARVVLASKLAASLIPAGLTTVFLDDGQNAMAAFRPPALSSANAAYMIYTSGSTGRPNGVEVPHAALINVFHAWRDAYNLKTVRRHLQMANFSFDVFTGDWVRALCSGGTLLLCPREWLLSPTELYRLIDRQRIDCAEFVPAVAALLTAYCQEAGKRLSGMKVCIAGSDLWTAAEYRQMQSVCGPDTRLINSYGVTEAAIDSSYYEDRGDLPDDSPVPIGRPFANMRLLILDRRLEPVPVGVPGHLYIGGDGLARGYPVRPGLTAERFIPDPSGHTPGARLYRTGDRARQLPTGNVEFLGRSDSQVKVRGYRVELSEIDAVMLAHAGVRRAAAIVSAARLVAYIEADATPFDVAPLKTALAASLPEYMVPVQFLVLAKLPLTPSGKVDRRALPDAPLDAATETYVAPRNDVEVRLAGIWAEVLRVPKVGIHDNFFETGGHSLLAIQIISRVNQTFGILLPLRSLFDAPTIAGQAMQIPAQDREEGEL